MNATTRPVETDAANRFGPGADAADARRSAFASTRFPEVFHAVAHRHEIARPDPLDVPSIHQAARVAFDRLLEWAATPPRPTAGRILLLLGEAGAGKTHLMRAFRNRAHGVGRGFCGYLQMTSATSDYARYLLNNLIDSLDQPYDESEGPTTGLMRIAGALARRAGAEAERLDDESLDPTAVAGLVAELADRVVVQDGFDAIDTDLVQALLFLRRDDPRLKGRVLKYLRCELLSPADRALLGGLVPRVYSDAAHRMIAKLGDLMATVTEAPLILLVDQLEDMFNFDDSERTFRRALAALKTVADNVPSSILVIACLEDYYASLRNMLTASVLDRVEHDPEPIRLRGLRDREEVRALIARRLEHLYGLCGVAFRQEEPTDPLAPGSIEHLAGLRTRDVLDRVRAYRERCARADALVDPGWGENAHESAPEPGPPEGPDLTPLERAWNDFRSTFAAEVPSDDRQLAPVLARALRASAEERPEGPRLVVAGKGHVMTVDSESPDGRRVRFVVGVCNKSAQGGALGLQVDHVADLAGPDAATPVIVRSTAFPGRAGTVIHARLAKLVHRGGRKVVVEDSDWRTMLAFEAFDPGHRDDPAFAAWRLAARPLSRLASIRAILGLDAPTADGR